MDSPQLRLVDVEDTENSPESSRRSPLALAPLDWGALGLLATALIVAGLGAGNFPTARSLLLPTESLLDSLQLIAMPLTVLLTALALLIVAWREWQRPVTVGGVPSLAGAAVLLVGGAALSMVRSPALGLSLNALTVLIAALLFGGLASRLARDRRGFAALLFVLIATATCVAAFGVREYLAKWKEGAPYHRVFATFVNPDFLAGYLLLTLPPTLSAFVTVSDRLARLALGIALALQTACLLLTGSRTGIALFALSLLIWLGLLLLTQRATLRQLGKLVALGGGIILLSAGLASAPARSRVVGTPTTGQSTATAIRETAAAQSHSGAFRRYTWIGTYKMAMANPILGTGLGAYDVTYPRYAQTAYTAHAHNTYLQWMAETGVPATLLLLVVLAAASAYAAHVLFRVPASEDDLPAKREALFTAPRVLLIGFLSGLCGSLAHNLIDSDGYIVAIAFTLSGLLGLMIAQARDIAPLTTQTPRRLGAAFLGVGVLLSLALLWRASGLIRSRMGMEAGNMALMDQQPEASLTAYQGAIAADPFDPEARLSTAQVVERLHPEEAEAAYQSAVKVAPIGKTYYRLGQFYLRNDKVKEAIEAFERACQIEPRNLQSLKALAEALRRGGQSERAVATYQTMAGLENTPYGTVRAMAELVETDFAYAHVGLAELALERQDVATADSEYGKAQKILREFWNRRNLLDAQAIPVEKRQRLTDVYEQTLLKRQGLNTSRSPEEAAALKTELEALQAEQKKTP